MNDTTVNDNTNDAAPATSAPATNAVGSGVMAARSPLEETTPQRQAIDLAKQTARTTGHRFDLLHYLRLRRQRPGT